MSARSRWTRCSTTPWAASLCLLALLATASAGWAAPNKGSGKTLQEDIPRKVVVLFDSRGGRTSDDNIVEQGLQMVFDHYGLIPVYRDIQAAQLPDDALMAQAAAVVSVLDGDSVRRPRQYLPWLLKQLRAGRKLILLGELGVSPTYGGDLPDVEEMSQAVYKALGAGPANLRGLDRRVFRYAKKAPGLADFERALPPQPVVSVVYEPLSRDLRPFVSLSHPGRPGAEFLAVFTGPGGGALADNFVYWESLGEYNRRKWYIDPFAFVRGALGLTVVPVPDPTTLNGLRVAYSHLDADGFAGYSRVDRGAMCAETLRDHVFKRYNFPITISLIVADVDPGIATDPKRARRAQEVAREILRLPNIEPGSHTFSHPFYWDAEGKTKTSYENRLPYNIPGYKFDDAKEIDYSIRFVSKLSPPDKPCRLLQWSGDCMPTARQIARVDSLGMLNINGGDTIYDRTRDSLFSVAPMYRVVGDRFQLYNSQANENVMTNLWKGPYHGYRNMIETFQRTGAPRRLKPINAYYHFYSGEYPASVKAVQDIYEWILAQSVAPVFTTQYLEMVQGYLKTRLVRTGPATFKIENYGHCLTVRLPAEAPEPNLERSVNLLGYCRTQEGLYVSLAPGQREATLSLEPGGKPRAYVNEATGFVSDFRLERGALSLSYKGFGTGRIRLAGLAPGAAVRVQGSALPRPDTLKADEKGRVDVRGLKNGRLEVALP